MIRRLSRRLAVIASAGCGIGVAAVGYRLGTAEVVGDPSAWFVTGQVPSALLAGVLAGFAGGAVARSGWRLAAAAFLAWSAGSVVFAVGWFCGKAASAPPAAASDLTLVIGSSLVVTALPVFGVSASVYGLVWLFESDVSSEPEDS